MMVVSQRARGFQQRDRVQVEYWLGLRMIASLHPVASQAQQVAYSHRGAAEYVPLDGDAVPISAGDLHDRRVADPGEQRADCNARHVAIGAATVGGVDRIDHAVEHTGPDVYLFRVGRIWRREFRGDGKLPRAQHALKPAGRSVPRQDRQPIARYRLVLGIYDYGPLFFRPPPP